MLHRIETMVMPNGNRVYIDMTNINYLADLKETDPDARESYYAEIRVVPPFGSYRSSYSRQMTLYGDERGLYKYKKQKEPIYFWKSQNIEEDYEHWTKTPNGYSIPLNEPRKLKKDYF